MKKKQPIFKEVFGDSWSDLPPAFKKHYISRAYTNDLVEAKGTMTIRCSWYMKLLAPFLKLTKALLPINADKVETVVHYQTSAEDNLFRINRSFNLSPSKTYHFNTIMQHMEGNKIVELTKAGIGWKANYNLVAADKIIIKSDGYVIKVCNRLIRLPLGVISGIINVEERVLSDKEFYMEMVITHKLFGEIYKYNGTFEII